MNQDRLPRSIYKVIACIVEYRRMMKAKKGQRLRGLGELAQRYGTDSKAIKRWSRRYAQDMRLFDMSQVQLLSKLAAKEERLVSMAAKYKNLRQSKPSLSAEGRVREQMTLLQEELRMFRDLYNDARQRLDISARANNVNRSHLAQMRRELSNLRAEAKRISPCIEDTSLDVYGEDHRSL